MNRHHSRLYLQLVFFVLVFFLLLIFIQLFFFLIIVIVFVLIFDQYNVNNNNDLYINNDENINNDANNININIDNQYNSNDDIYANDDEKRSLLNEVASSEVNENDDVDFISKWYNEGMNSMQSNHQSQEQQYGGWSCPVCQFCNQPEINLCQMCNQFQKRSDISFNHQSNHSSLYNLNNNSNNNEKYATTSSSEGEETKKKKKKDIINKLIN